MKSKSLSCSFLNKDYVDCRKMILKRRQDASDNCALIDIQVILNDDFYIQQTACLNELIYEKYEILFSKKYINFNLSQSDFIQKRYGRYIRAQRSELFSTFAQRLAYEMVNKHFYL
jgi:hypothetical protein